MNRFVRTIVAAAGLLTLIAPATGSAHDDTNDARLRTDLSGFSEVIPPNLGLGAIFSTGSGRLKLKIDKQNRSIDYELTYSFPDAAATPVVGAQFVNQAHLHFGQKHTGGINVWLCQSTDNPAPAAASGTPTCPSPSGTMTRDHSPRSGPAACRPGIPCGSGRLRCAPRSAPERCHLRERPH